MASVTFSRWEPSRKRHDSRAIRAKARMLLYGGALVVVSAILGEGGLRIVEVYYDQAFAAVLQTARHPLPPGATVGGRTVNALGYVDDDFDPAPPVGKTRVALLGGRATLAGDAATNLAAQLERLLPGVEIDHFGIPAGNPHRYAAQLQRDVLRFQPQFVLVCLSPADDVAATEAPAVWSSMRLLELTGLSNARPVRTFSPETALESLTETLDYETYVRRRTSPVAACRTDADAAAQKQWKVAQASLARIVADCRKRNIGVAAVLAPSDFQLSPQLAEALRRRAGLNEKQIDFQLPQRRWTALTDHLKLPALDLLPTFLASEAVLFETASPDWNEKGRRLAAETTARWLQARLSGEVAMHITD